MKLLYVWIKKHGNIVEQGFNFSGEYTFTLEESEKNKTPNLRVEKNEEYIDLFNTLGDNVPMSITGIIGKNGSGKSTLIDFLITHLVEGHNNPTPNAIFAFKNDVGTILIYHKLPLNIGYEGHLQKLDNLREYWGKHSTVYFTNTFYDRVNSTSWAGIYNISLRGLLEHNDHTVRTRESIPLVGNQNIRTHQTEELRRIVYFYNEYKIDENSDKQEALINNLPKILFININKLAEKKVFEDKFSKFQKDKILLERIRQYFALPTLDGRTTYEKFKFSLYRHLVFHIIDDQNEPYVHKEWESTLEKLILDDNSRTSPLPLNEQFYILREGIQTIANTHGKDSICNHIIELLKFFDDNFKEKNRKEGIIITLEYMLIPLDYNNIIDDLLRIYPRTTIYSMGYLDFDFSYEDSLAKLSAGERAYLGMFARFYSIKRMYSDRKLRTNLLIIIDEGDLYLHPEWQREFVYRLYEYLPKIYPHHNLQILLTSHSPFITSDIPKNDIIFLKSHKNEETQEFECKVIPSRNIPLDTFGANIHSLFKSSFFLDKGLIGKFAKSKIQTVINWLNQEDANQELKDQILEVINLIGEPIVQKHLLDIYNDKLGIDNEIDKIEQEIRLLQERKNKLTNKKNKGNDTN